MLSLAQEIAEKVSLLPEQEQQEVVDFVEYLSIKLERQKAKRVLIDRDVKTEGAKMLGIMEDYGLLGCMEGDGNLSENYKQHLWGNG